MAKQELIIPQAQMTPDKLHVTLNMSSASDMKYQKRFLSQGKQKTLNFSLPIPAKKYVHAASCSPHLTMSLIRQ